MYCSLIHLELELLMKYLLSNPVSSSYLNKIKQHFVTLLSNIKYELTVWVFHYFIIFIPYFILKSLFQIKIYNFS